VKLLD